MVTDAAEAANAEEIGALSPQQQQDIPRVMDPAKKFGLEILPSCRHDYLANCQFSSNNPAMSISGTAASGLTLTMA